VNKPPSAIAAWQALYRNSKSPHPSSISIPVLEVVEKRKIRYLKSCGMTSN